MRGRWIRSLAIVAAAVLIALLPACVAAPSELSKQAPLPAPAPAPEQPVPAPEPPAEKLVAYTGPVEHVFFHPLVVYPARAFDGDSLSTGFDDWFVTVPEFRRIVEELYQNNYILIGMDEMLRADDTVTARTLMLPAGKKPLILSIDDLNYYAYMRENGTAFKLISGENGRIGTYSVTPAGEERIAYDNEIIPLLDSFVAEHPDFSFRGAKGIIALTGYEGILGYQTHRPAAPGYQQEDEGARQVVRRLKETGWTFASHSWSHLDMAKISYGGFISDLKRWQAEVGPLVGPTPVYIYPFGSAPPTGDPKFQALLDAGFRIFCTVGPTPYQPKDGRYASMERRHLDGMAFRQQAGALRHLFDARALIDPVRPKR